MPKEVFKTIDGRFILPAAHGENFTARQPMFLSEVDRIARAQGFVRYSAPTFPAGTEPPNRSLAFYKSEWCVYLQVVLPSGATVPRVRISGKNTVTIGRALKSLLKTLREVFPDLQFEVTTDEYFDYT